MTRDGQPTTYEGEPGHHLQRAEVKGLSLRFRNGYVGRGQREVVKDFRIILNYELNLL